MATPKGKQDITQSTATPTEAFGNGLDKITSTLGALLKNVEDTADQACALLEAHNSSVGFFRSWHDALSESKSEEELDTSQSTKTDSLPKEGTESEKPEDTDYDSFRSEIV